MSSRFTLDSNSLLCVCQRYYVVFYALPLCTRYLRAPRSLLCARARSVLGWCWWCSVNVWCVGESNKIVPHRLRCLRRRWVLSRSQRAGDATTSRIALLRCGARACVSLWNLFFPLSLSHRTCYVLSPSQSLDNIFRIPPSFGCMGRTVLVARPQRTHDT